MSRRSLARCAAAAALALALAGCAGPRPVPDDRAAAWSELSERLRSLTQWRAEGRIAVRGNGEPGTVNFTWIESPRRGFSLRLEGPWGQNVGRLDVEPARVALTTRDGRRFVGTDPATLVERLYGWQIPVRALRHWLIGLPGDGRDYTLDRYGRLATLEWRGWRIDYRRHRGVDGLDLPVDLRARRSGDGTEIRVAVDRWQVADDDGEPVEDSPVPLMGG